MDCSPERPPHQLLPCARDHVEATLARAGGGRDLEAQATAKPGDEKKQFAMHFFGAVFAEVRIDADLGIIRVPRIVARYDVGRLLNAKTGQPLPMPSSTRPACG